MRYADIIAEESPPQDPPAPILVLVHPDSACGSADFNLGDEEADRARQGLSQELYAWKGGVIVILGDDAGELRSYGLYARAIKAALDFAKADRRISLRLRGPDPQQMAVITRTVKKLALRPETQFVVTGAWTSAGDSGCVNSVEQALKAAGFLDVRISPHAVREDEG